MRHRKHRQFFDLLAAPATRPVWEPPIDVYADDRDVRVVVALPGARAEDVTVQITSTGLLVDTNVAPGSAGLNVVRMEIPYGRMRRRVDLPPGRYSLVERRLDRGCLYLRLTREG